MFHRVDYKNQPKPIILSKGMSNYDKLQKTMNEPVKEYNQIKDLVELENNSITKLSNTMNKKSKNVEMMPHKAKIKNNFYIRIYTDGYNSSRSTRYND